MAASLAHALAAGVLQAATFFWDSLFGLIFGFLVSAIVQVMLTPATLERYLGPGLRGLLYGAGFGVISSSCSYGAAAAARGFYRSGADIRSVFAFLISSTNMNLAILILFWSLLGWRFAFAEFFGGVIIIAVVTLGLSLLFGNGQLARLQREYILPLSLSKGQDDTRSPNSLAPARSAVLSPSTSSGQAESKGCEHHRSGAPMDRSWRAVATTAIADVRMLRTELIVGYLIAGFAAALVPVGALAAALRAVGSVPFIGYVLLLIVGLSIAVATFVCSMGNVPVARYLANAGIPLGANTTFIYGDLLILPLIAIYRKSFPERITWAFVGLFVAGAMLAGAIMERIIGGGTAAMTAASMTLNDRFTLISNIVALAAVAVLALATLGSKARGEAS
ncbi:MAG: permease [Candidatus Cybelea sp.]